ncbi:uncharacterized protein LOC129115546 [Anoplopoma fimbria]|uniref:uncharacterized protein LOC129115546 n=2 Tax=Anoplopoma fimbria TaxID=229290 RepID=UPI0023EB2A79|nr:uncharacterized protein LOC129115546 [Anoplopoma fimbria]
MGSCTYVTSVSVSDSSAACDFSNMANNKRQGQLDLRDYFGFKRTKSTTEEQDNHGEEAGRRAEEPRAGEGTDRNMTLPKAVATLSRQVRVLKSMAEQPGPAAEVAQTAMGLKLFKGVPLTNNLRHSREINHQHFFHALAAKIESRMGSLPGKQRSKEEYQSFLNNVKVLQPSNWPDVCGVRYAEKEIQELCSFFKLDNGRQIQRGMREYIDMVKLKSVGEMTPQAPEELKPLLQAVNTLVISTAECERGFSQMNILTTTRNTLEVKSMSALLFIKCVGPPLQMFKPDVYVKSWLQSHCLANDLRARARKVCIKKHDYETLWKLL